MDSSRSAIRPGYRWWRWNDYVIRDGAIVPAPGAALEEYDPWGQFVDARQAQLLPAAERSERFALSGPHLELARLFDEVALDVGVRGQLVLRSPAAQRKLLDWCRRWGVLGDFPHRARAIFLEPRRAADATALVQDAVVLEAGAWRRRVRIDLVPGTDPSVVVPSGVLLAGGGDLSLQPLPAVMRRWFPGRARLLPLPLSSQFWARYAEPIDAFVNAAVQTRRALLELAHAPGESPPGTELNRLLAPVATVMESTESGGVVQRWRSPSLLGVLAAMAADDAAAGALRCCTRCGRLFRSLGYQADYCSTTCRWTAQKRRHRERKRTG